jgi:hypothetical protein
MVVVSKMMVAPEVLEVAAVMTFSLVVLAHLDKVMLAVNHLALDILLVRVVGALELLV